MKIILTFTLLMIPGVVRSMSVTGYSGSEVNITCKYSKGDRAKAKYFCRGKKPNKPKHKWCSELIRTNEKDKWVHSGRFSLYDDTRSAVFTVTIRNLRELDSGTYNCGVDRTRGRYSHTEVNLKVIRETDYDRTTSSSSSVESPAITSVSPVTGSSLVVSVSVVLMLIIIGLVFVIWTVCRRRQLNNADSSSKRSHATPANNEAVSHTGFDYKELKDTHRHLPTSPSDSSATVEKASGDSQCRISSAEDLNYAVVNFHKRSDCPDSVSFRNNQDYSEYAAVNHLTTAENVMN
ncbi:CMRF35-like molecule 5 [Megalobrama amblycephala]|uniref:CMRF35-like molecule 5 n=1 Tax=Megalobrama amblycephala TaxID=75352 RepID=UPI002013F80F|nr:CMRF35-like molecule 5 [Megalobrama amblycephala]XP_048051301.1 CMRF35-like molecule 5 [Megalobrama amblycephala]